MCFSSAVFGQSGCMPFFFAAENTNFSAVALIGEFVINESFTVDLLELVHPDEIRSRLPIGGRRKVSQRILIALLRDGVVRVVGECEADMHM